MAYKTDIEIAREANKKPIQEIGAKLGIGSDERSTRRQRVKAKRRQRLAWVTV